MSELEAIGKTYCPLCGPIEITTVENVTILYSKGIESPKAKIVCEHCGMEYIIGCDWHHARLFDLKGSKVEGYSFKTGTLTEEDIEDFVAHMPERIYEFLDEVEQGPFKE